MYTNMYTVEEDFLLRLLIFIDIKSRYGAPREIRTPDQLVRSQLLYPAELWAREPKYSQDLSTGHRPFALFTSVGFKTTNTLSMMLASMIYSHPKPLQNRIQE